MSQRVADAVLFDSPICLSGGADGADVQFGFCAGWAGHLVVHWVFDKHRSSAPAIELAVLPQAMLNEADEHLEIANRSLARSLPKHRTFIMNLLRRNYYQVASAEACYAVSSIKDGKVAGGTAWATQMFIDRHDGDSCACYVYDQLKEGWFVWKRMLRQKNVEDDPLVAGWEGFKGSWEPIEAPPRPTGIYAGIGSRKLLESGKKAIRALYGYTPALIAECGTNVI